ncbi:MAG: triphosphoribosyl-dephospho-CoA synthase [Candidatus Bathyarchaeota archaeon BA1]|nr:MAG: triphosphoribosyl-dephospho-CoA synthase [Candidatus Bathyarchaeota archaeon BA1]
MVLVILPQKHRVEIADDVMRAGQLAAALEVCGWPKPGNVHRTTDFPDTRFEHFIAGSISLGPTIRDSALRGMAAEVGEVKMGEIGIGGLIKRAVLDMRTWHKGENTHLGVILLFMPIAVAAGMTLASLKSIDVTSLRESFVRVMGSTGCEDAVEVYDAIVLANPGGLGKVKGGKAPDLTSEGAKRELVERGLTLHDVMRVSAAWDTIARELTTALQITLNTGYPTLQNTYVQTRDINITTVHTYLKLLSLFPDTFVARNVGLKYTSEISKAVEIGMKKAREISIRAERILQLGGLTTPEGREALFEFDKELRRQGKELSPGTTADLTAASLMIALLCGLRF